MGEGRKTDRKTGKGKGGGRKHRRCKEREREWQSSGGDSRKERRRDGNVHKR